MDGIQLLFMGFLSEYISNINIRTMGRPLVIEPVIQDFKVRGCVRFQFMQEPN